MKSVFISRSDLACFSCVWERDEGRGRMRVRLCTNIREKVRKKPFREVSSRHNEPRGVL